MYYVCRISRGQAGDNGNTVRTHMRAIFQKLQIDRRTCLAEKLK